LRASPTSVGQADRSARLLVEHLGPSERLPDGAGIAG